MGSSVIGRLLPGCYTRAIQKPDVITQPDGFVE